MRVSKSLLIIMVGLLFFAKGNVMARPDPLKFNRGQIADLTFDEDSKSQFIYDMGIALANGDIPNMFCVDKFGENDNVSQNQDNDIWDLGGIYPFLTEATVLTISSSTSTDEASNTGARIVKVFTLDDTWSFASQIATMNGQSVFTLGSQMRVYRAFVDDAGSNNGAEATIHIGFGTITAGVPANRLAILTPESNQTLMAIMSVPSNHFGYIKRWYVGFDGITGTARFGNVNLCSIKNGLIRRIRRKQGIATDVAPHQESFYMPIRIEEKQDVLLMMNNASVNNLSVSGGFDMVFIKKT